MELQGRFLPGEAENAHGLAPVKEANEDGRKADRKDSRFFVAAWDWSPNDLYPTGSDFHPQAGMEVGACFPRFAF